MASNEPRAQQQSQPSNPDQSFSMLAVGDVEAVGAHCQMTYCHQLDFLPFRCDSCHSTFCLDHRSETAHNCPKAGEWARNRRRNSLNRSSTPNTTGTSTLTTSKPTLATGTQCYETSCKTFVNTPQSVGVRCDTCNRQYCLKHRLREEHDCKNVVPLGAKTTTSTLATNKEKIRFGFSRIRSWGKSQQSDLEKRMQELKPKPKPTSAAARTVALNKMKAAAKGDEKVPSEKRVYLHVEAEKETTRAKMPQMALWFSSEWSVGKVLDDAAKRLQVANSNNTVDEEETRLRVFHVDDGRVLDFGEKLGKAGVQSGHTIVLLRGVGPGAPSVRT
ncbi:AN1-type zinc finger protein 1 [Cyphellophora attinorum]|uniref:AN1-type zinc finger protein 1 n=1 Tax=Cyphellophora attinorum TaxID=1664694 RepID=A0A0N0NK66_9EURO|nr:AN1-type zinc finger protein 1 [Phialophora attinorum]KPI37469.1 AN1-type zinc finger protein 1 [Phialophora attinorum]